MCEMFYIVNKSQLIILAFLEVTVIIFLKSNYD